MNFNNKGAIIWYLPQEKSNGYTITKYYKDKLETITIDNQYTSINLSKQGLFELKIIKSSCSLLYTLKVLKLQHNNISNIPDHLFDLTSLESLNLGHNQISTISNKIGKLTNLKELYIQKNKIKELPQSLAFLPITNIDISDNEISCLPFEFKYLKLNGFWYNSEIKENDNFLKNLGTKIPTLKELSLQKSYLLCKFQLEIYTLNAKLKNELKQNPIYYCSICKNMLLFNHIKIFSSFVFYRHLLPFYFTCCSQKCRSLAFLASIEGNSSFESELI